MPDATDSEHCPKCSFDQLEALYQINVEAKKYAESASNNYSRGAKARARHHSIRKKALYAFKQSILESLVERDCVDEVRLHKIDNREYYCLYIGEFSFHSPVDDWSDPPADDLSASPTELDSFESAAGSRSDSLSEREALTRLSDVFGTPNDYLSAPFVEYHHPEFAGWSYLPGAIEEGDKVDGRFGRDTQSPYEEFLFVAGDEFDTQNGHCRIRDRYEAWLTPLWDQSPITPRPVYDVELDGELREGVRQRRLVDDWYILAETLHDPLPDVEGRQAELAGSSYEQPVEFDLGDIVEIDPDRDESGPYYWRIVQASISYNLVLCKFEPVGPTEHSEPSLAVEEFADDVVAVHDSPPALE
ncbi:hypothetical protein [Haloplanus pelagicus]|uniref:hypothetical protein n=1 Tax=Haloplanus pelagicus TaxID=2949995 RepID=UPI00203E14A3|nr:hypothetical protein [Haloplanus sp. HW8-1]